MNKTTLGSLTPPKGSRRARRRRGRGPGSGLGKTAGKGHKGQKARTGGKVRPGFEGGQMPLIRRVPKRGFTNPFRVAAQVVNLRALGALSGKEVTPEVLVGLGMVRRADAPVKILGDGDAPAALIVRGLAVSKAARTKIEAAGGKVEA